MKHKEASEVFHDAYDAFCNSLIENTGTKEDFLHWNLLFDVNPITNSPVDMMFDLYISQLKSEGIIEDK